MTLALNQKKRDEWVRSVAARIPPGSSVLDVGAGECRYRDLFAHSDYRAHDFGGYSGTADGLFEERWKYGDLDYVSDITEIPVPDSSFDVVLCTEVLEHVLRPLAAIDEMARILKSEGRLYLSAPLGSGLHQEPFHYYGGFTPGFYEAALGAAGLQVVSITPNGGFFQLLTQELERARSIVATSGKVTRWHPAYVAVRAVSNRFTISRLLALDDIVPTREFTVGYHVEAVKPSS